MSNQNRQKCFANAKGVSEEFLCYSAISKSLRKSVTFRPEKEIRNPPAQDSEDLENHVTTRRVG